MEQTTEKEHGSNKVALNWKEKLVQQQYYQLKRNLTQQDSCRLKESWIENWKVTWLYEESCQMKGNMSHT